MVNTLRPLPLGHLVKTVYKNTESDHSKNDENNNMWRQNLCRARKNGMAGHESRKFRNKKLLYIFGNFAQNRQTNFIDIIFDIMISVPKQWQMKKSKIKVK